MKIYNDTAVLLSACYSKTGASSLILGYCRRRKIKGYVTRYVLSEVKRNAPVKLDEKGKQRLNFYLLQSKRICSIADDCHSERFYPSIGKKIKIG